MSDWRDFLRKVPLFADLPEADLGRLCHTIVEVPLVPGQVLFEEGTAGEKAYVIEDGQLEIVKTSSGRDVLLAVRGPGDVIGETALLEDAPRMATARARTTSRLLAIDKGELDELVQSSASAARAMFFTVLARWRATSAMLRQGEKMAQLGTLTAGVAHELNNPAAAVKRAVSQLEEAIRMLGAAEAQVAPLRADEAQRAALEQLAARARARAGKPEELDAMARSDREQSLEAWLEERGVPDPWELAPTLVSLDYDGAALGVLAAGFATANLAPVVGWLGTTYAVNHLMAQIGQGAARISEIVKALKSYSYLDQAPMQAVDVHQGLDNTLLILRSKLKDGISVRRDYAPDLPKIQAHGSELNQVWTNLIDNAADALNGKGHIDIRTHCDRDWVAVSITDDGPGIPEAIQHRVFDAFFTTKPPGKGTGLGLDISYNIVVHKHRGDIRVSSRPGHTTFEVKLPVNPDGAGPEARAMAAIARPPDAVLRQILETSHTLAVVGLSGDPHRPAHAIPAFLQARGYRIIPVNPKLTEALGEKAYGDLRAIPDPVDAVVIFRNSEAVPPIVDDAVAIGARVVWMQEGVIHERAADRAREAGLAVVMDTCMRATWSRLLGPTASRAPGSG